MDEPEVAVEYREPKAVRSNQLLTETVMPTMCTCSPNIGRQRLAGCQLFRPAKWRCRCKADMCFPQRCDCNGPKAPGSREATVGP